MLVCDLGLELVKKNWDKSINKIVKYVLLANIYFVDLGILFIIYWS